jgi:hypothetical protein
VTVTYLELFSVTRNPTLCQVISLIFTPLCNIHIIFTVLYLESVITLYRVYLYHIVFKKEVARVLNNQSSTLEGN